VYTKTATVALPMHHYIHTSTTLGEIVYRNSEKKYPTKSKVLVTGLEHSMINGYSFTKFFTL